MGSDETTFQFAVLVMLAITLGLMIGIAIDVKAIKNKKQQ